MWIGVSVGTVCAAGLLILVITEVLIGWSAITATGQPADYVIVLGARVRGTKISNSLKQRLDRAIEYSEEYPNTVLVLSGGKGPGEEISEAALVDSDGDVVAIKTMYPKKKDEDVSFTFEFDDEF